MDVFEAAVAVLHHHASMGGLPRSWARMQRASKQRPQNSCAPRHHRYTVTPLTARGTYRRISLMDRRTSAWCPISPKLHPRSSGVVGVLILNGVVGGVGWVGLGWGGVRGGSAYRRVSLPRTSTGKSWGGLGGVGLGWGEGRIGIGVFPFRAPRPANRGWLGGVGLGWGEGRIGVSACFPSEDLDR